MNRFPVVKIEIFVPEQYIERLRDELSHVGAGHIGNYDHCISITDIRGSWRPPLSPAFALLFCRRIWSGLGKFLAQCTALARNICRHDRVMYPRVQIN